MFSIINAMTSYSSQAGTMIANGCSLRVCSWAAVRGAKRRFTVNARDTSRIQYQTSMNRSSMLESVMINMMTTATRSRNA